MYLGRRNEAGDAARCTQYSIDRKSPVIDRVAELISPQIEPNSFSSKKPGDRSYRNSRFQAGVKHVLVNPEEWYRLMD